jgi:DnaJ-class molecular chaperone
VKKATDNKARPVLEVPCDVCAGTGRGDGEKCLNCNGSGHAPTEAGMAVINLVKHQLSAIFEWALE